MIDNTLQILEQAKSADRDAREFYVNGRLLAASIAYDRAAKAWRTLGCVKYATLLEALAESCRGTERAEYAAAVSSGADN